MNDMIIRRSNSVFVSGEPVLEACIGTKVVAYCNKDRTTGTVYISMQSVPLEDAKTVVDQIYNQTKK